MADVFIKILTKPATNRQLAGLMQELGGWGVISMQYVDDTMLFLEKILVLL
jgi:hypothetical protein